MSEYQNFMRMYSTPTASETSVAGEDLVKKLRPNDTDPHFKVLSFMPKSTCTLIINKGMNSEETVIVTPDLGMNRDDRFRYIKTLEFVEDGVEYYFLYGI